jgi:hypothetical protein
MNSVTALLVDGDAVFAGNNHGCYRSLDSGGTWEHLAAGSDSLAFEDLGIANGRLFANVNWHDARKGYNGFYLFSSSDRGASWTADSTGLSFDNSGKSCPTALGSVLYTYIAADPNLFRSSDNGATWSIVNSKLPFAAETTPIQSYGALLLVGTTTGLLVSADSGGSWKTRSQGLSSSQVPFILEEGRTLLLGTAAGFFRSVDTGMNWVAMNEGFTSIPWAIGLAASNDGMLYLIAFDVSKSSFTVWRRPLSEMIGPSAVAERAKPNETALQAYPNPFSEKTLVHFTTPERGPVQVSVVNLLGVEAARLFEGELESGEHSFTWDARQVPAGVYECIVRTAGSAQRVPMMIVR